MAARVLKAGSARTISTDRADATDEIDELRSLAAAIGCDPDDLERAGRAWLVGGADALSALHDRFDASPDALRRAAEALGREGRQHGNNVTTPHIRLRIDANGSWWRFDADHRLGWVLSSGGFDDPAEALG